MIRLEALRLPIYVVDAFSSQPFSGNPAAVCLCAPGVQLADTVRQRIAAEMNHSETAFIEPLDVTGASEPAPTSSSSTSAPACGHVDVFSSARAFRLRWFTPTCEVPCCGHATLASAAVLLQARNNPHPTISFHTLSGELVVSRAAPAPPAATTILAATTNNSDQAPPAPAPPLSLSLFLPLYDPVDPIPPCAADPAGPLARACTGSLPVVEVRYCGRGGLKYVLMELAAGPGGAGRRELEALRPDFEAMARAAPGGEVQGVIVCVWTGGAAAGAGAGGDLSQAPRTQAAGGGGEAAVAAAAEAEPEVCSRFFAPWMGINEDPVTGSAHAVLGPYWEPRLRPTAGAQAAGVAVKGAGSVCHSGAMRMRQCSARGGEVAVEVLRCEARVMVTGGATLVLEGTLRL